MGFAGGAEGDRAAAQACASGIATACSILGRVQLLRGLARYAGDDRRTLTQDAADLLERGCELDDWSACISAASAHAFTRGPRAGQRGGALLARGVEMANKACVGQDQLACTVLADDLRERGDPASAVPLYERACALQLGLAEARDQAGAAKSGACEVLTELGRPLPPPVSQNPRSGRVAERVILAKRISGTLQVIPSDSVKLDLHKRGIRRIIATMHMCISAVGLVDSITLLEPSRWPGWDLRLLEAVRLWRFDPFKADGVAQPVCSHFTWIYNQKN